MDPALIDPAAVRPPARVVDLELSEPIPALATAAATDEGGPYRSAVILARLHRRPLGLVALELPEAGLTAERTASIISSALGPAIVEHLGADGAPFDGLPADRLPVDGLGAMTEPACRAGLRQAVAAAPPLSVVIATRDRPGLVVDCIEAIAATGYPGLEIVVVDNAPSDDATRTAIAGRSAGRPPIRYVRTPRAGTARARNVGSGVATAELIAFVDDDVLVDADWAAAVVGPFLDDPTVGCVTTSILAAELDTPAQCWIEQYGGFGKGFERRTYDLGPHRPTSPLFPYAAGTFGSGASMAFRARALREAGGFDPALGGGTPARGGEDLAAFVDVILAGWRLVYEPAAIVRHHHHREYERLRAVMFGYGSGLSAYLSHLLARDPGRLVDVGRRAGAGLVYLLDRGSAKNERKRPDYPVELTRRELAGLAWGPLAYARGRARRPPVEGGHPVAGGRS